MPEQAGIAWSRLQALRPERLKSQLPDEWCRQSRLGGAMVTVEDVVGQLGLKVAAGEDWLGREVSGGYVGDLLSCVMARAARGNLWVTVQGHPNVVAVAVLVGVSGVVVSEGARIDPATLEKARQEGIPILSSPKSSFTIVAELVALGVKGDGC